MTLTTTASPATRYTRRVDLEGAGFVMMSDHMVVDPLDKVVDAARVSHASEARNHTEAQNARLRQRLIADHHTAPMRHSPITLHVRAPEFIARQWYKHIVGGEYAFKDTPWSEVSQRYHPVTDVYRPRVLHEQATRNKQAAAGEHKAAMVMLNIMHGTLDHALTAYEQLLEAGVSREEARIVLPLAIMTEWYWTASMQALRHFVNLRNSPDAQGLMQEYAAAVDLICFTHYGDAWGEAR